MSTHRATSPTTRLSRRTVGGAALALGALGATGPTASAVSSRPGPATGRGRWAERAEDAYAALQRHFAVRDGSRLYLEHWPAAPEDPTYSYEWPFSQAHGATLDLTGLPGATGRRYLDDLAERRTGQRRYYSAAGSTGLPGYASAPTAPWGSGGDFFYDDNEWVGLIDVQRHLMHRDPAAVRDARMIFELVVSGWDDDPSHPAPGGVFWTQADWSQDRNTVSNMPGAQLGLRLFQLTRERRFLDWARRMYAWTNQHLQIREGAQAGLYHDHLDLAGTVEKTVWSYNQGVPVGVNTLLHRVTGERRYLREACRVADAARRFYAQPDPEQPGLTRLDTQPVFFNSIYFKNLLLLASVTGDRRAADDMAAYADRLWRTRRDRETGVFRFGGDSTQMIEQAAVVQLFAVLAWSRKDWSLLY